MPLRRRIGILDATPSFPFCVLNALPVPSRVTVPLLASVELGGTKTIVALATRPTEPLFLEKFATADPKSTLARIVGELARGSDRLGPIAALGVATFGPVRLDRRAPDWGRMIATPKAGWSGAGVGPELREGLGLPLILDTDVNAAAMAEARLGAGQGCANLAYVTVGTGIGGGLVLDGEPRHGLLHPEVGHMLVRRHPDDAFPGTCPYHGDCLEGLASGSAISARLGAPLDTLGADHPFRTVLADYLAQLCLTLTLVASVERIVVGGGAVRSLALLPQVADRLRDMLGGYGESLAGGPVLTPPAFEDSGLVGGFLLAARAASAPD